MVSSNGLLNVLTVYAHYSGKLEEEKESFGNDMFYLVSCIPTQRWSPISVVTGLIIE